MKAPLVVVTRSQEEKKKKKTFDPTQPSSNFILFPVVSFTHFFSFIFLVRARTLSSPCFAFLFIKRNYVPREWMISATLFWISARRFFAAIFSCEHKEGECSLFCLQITQVLLHCRSSSIVLFWFFSVCCSPRSLFNRSFLCVLLLLFVFARERKQGFACVCLCVFVEVMAGCGGVLLVTDVAMLPASVVLWALQTFGDKAAGGKAMAVVTNASYLAPGSCITW